MLVRSRNEIVVAIAYGIDGRSRAMGRDSD
jgi:hypothetical protein